MTKTDRYYKSFLFKYRDALVCLFLVLATLAVHWQVQNYDFVNFDDDKYIYENRHVQGGFTLESVSWAFTTAHMSNWHPLTWLSHMLDCQLFGLDPGWHHFTNLFLHIANTLLLFFVLKRMTKYLWRSVFVATLFALHPLHVESVAWVSERKDVLSAFFWMLTMWSYIWYVEYPAVNRYILVILFFTLGLMSKPMIVTLPFVLLLLDYWPLNRLRIEQSGNRSNSQQRSIAFHLVWEKAPLFVLVAISSFVTFYAQKHGGSVAPLYVIPLKVRIANALVAYASYIWKMIYPSKLAVLYPYSGMLPWWKITGACVLLVSISFLAIKVIKQRAYLAVGWLWYLGTLVPVIGLVQVGNQTMADRYTYIPLIGLFIIIAWGVPELVAQWRHRKIWLATSATAILSILMAVTLNQVGYWKNSAKLFQHAIEVTSNNYISHYNLGMVLAAKNEYDEAIRHFSATVRINPSYANARNNLGNSLLMQGKIDEAIAHYQAVLRIQPDHIFARKNLLSALAKQRIKDTVVKTQKTPKIINKNAILYYRQGNLHKNKGELDDAIDQYQKALSSQPDFIPALNDLALAYVEKGEYNRAFTLYQKIINLNPDSYVAYYNIACMYAKQNKVEQSVDWLKNAVNKGFQDFQFLENDQDLENIRESSYYKEILTLIKNHSSFK